MGWWMFYKAGPVDHVVKYVGGKKRTEGRGGMFFVGPRTTLARVALADQSVPFAFTELTSDGQKVVVQGELQIRLVPDVILLRRDFSIDPKDGHYTTDDPDKVNEETTHTLQTFVRQSVQVLPLQKLLGAAAALEAEVYAALGDKPDSFTQLGVSAVNLFIASIVPANPDLAKALEAEARERLLSAADRAIADRRKEAAANDRALKEYETETAELLEERRKKLVAARTENMLSEAKAEAEASEMKLGPYKNLEAGVLLALGVREMAMSGRVGSFNLTPEFLMAVQGIVGGGSGAPTPKE